MLVSGVPLDLNWFLQFILTVFIIAVGLLHVVKNTASKYFEVDANFETGGATARGGGGEPSDSDHSPIPGFPMEKSTENTACVVCAIPGSKVCSGCKAVRYCSQKCQQSHWKSEHKMKCKDLQLSGRVNSTACSSGIKTSGVGGKKYSSIALVPARGTCKLIKQTKKILFPYDEFVEIFNWNKPGFPPCGLLNCGNSCFANVVLQCLAFTRPLVAYLLEKGHRKECGRNDWCFLCEFQSHIERASQSQAFSPISILSRLPNIGGNLGYGRQEDAHEFMRFAIDNMQSVCLDEFGGEKSVDPSSQETTLIQHIFGGHLQSQVICTKCNNISNQYENMMDLTVEIHGDAASLEECLDQFTVKEGLHGENMYKCDGCNDYVKAWKQLTVKRAPNILTIALKRFQSGRFGKLNKRVTFPETLDLSPYMSEAGDGTDVYKLYAVVVHVDMLNASFFGHYICYTKDFRGKWYRIDDCKVTTVELEEVLSQGAYMLLYCRVHARPSCLRTVEPSGKDERQLVQVEVESITKEQVGCFTTAESLNPTNSFLVPSDGSPCPTVSSYEEESSTGMDCEVLEERIEDMNVVSVKSGLSVSMEDEQQMVQVEVESITKEQVGCFTTAESLNPTNSFLVPSDGSPCPNVSSYEEESSTGMDCEVLEERIEDMNVVSVKSGLSVSMEVSSCENQSSFGVNVEAISEDPEEINIVRSGSNSPVSKEFSTCEIDSPIEFTSEAGREHQIDVKRAHFESCRADFKEVSCCARDSYVSINCKAVEEDEMNVVNLESSPFVVKDIEVYGNGHTDQNEIASAAKQDHKLVSGIISLSNGTSSAETHKLKHERPLCSSDIEDESGTKRVEIMDGRL